MLQCKVDYLAIHGRDDHAIALFIWDDKDANDAVHIALDAEVFKKGTFHQIAETIEVAINSCFQAIAKKNLGSEEETKE